MIFELTTRDLRSISVEVPDTLADMSLVEYITFTTHRTELLEWLSDELKEETIVSNSIEYIVKLAECISDVCKIDLDELMGVDVSDIISGTTVINLDQHLKALTEGELMSLENSLTCIYYYINKVINDYHFEPRTSENYEFEFKGKTYEIPYVVTTLFSKSKIFSKVLLCQAVEVLQIKRKLIKTISDKTIDKNKNYTATLTQIAILVREKGEEIKLDATEFEQQIAKRVEIFKDIDAKTGMDVCFFLTFIMLN